MQTTAPTAERSTAGLMTVDDVAELLAVSTRTVRRMADAGHMPRPLTVGTHLIRWRAETGDPMTGIHDWIAAGCQSCRPTRGTVR